MNRYTTASNMESTASTTANSTPSLTSTTLDSTPTHTTPPTHTRNLSQLSAPVTNNAGDTAIPIDDTDYTTNTNTNTAQPLDIDSTAVKHHNTDHSTETDKLNYDEIYAQYGAPKRAHWSNAKKFAFVGCIMFVMGIVTLIVLIVFLVRTPNVQVGSVQVNCPNYIACLKSGLPLSVNVLVDNDNIIGADVSGPVYLYTGAGAVLSQGSIVSKYVGARTVTALDAAFVLKASAETAQLALQVIIQKKNYTINVTADIDLKVALIHTSLTYNTTYIITPQSLGSIGLSDVHLMRAAYEELGYEFDDSWLEQAEEYDL